jgi:uncharacterized protein YqjF (DUF2071 family)
MSWHDLLFMHWPVHAESLRGQVPPGLGIDTHDGDAWLGVVPFRMTGVRPRCTPRLPGLHAFAELNVRTYVVAEGKPGVWFFSLDAASRLAVRGARHFFHLPYFDARMSSRREDAVVYRSERTHRGAPEASFAATYRGTGTRVSGELERWLTERYCLYAANQEGRLYRGEIHHPRWPLETAEAEVEKLDMTRILGFDLPPSKPLLHFNERLDVVAWLLEPLVARGRS